MTSAELSRGEFGGDLTVAEAAPLLRVKDSTVRSWIKSGKLKAHKTITGQWRIYRSEVERARGVDGPHPEALEA